MCTVITSCSNGAEPLPEPSPNEDGAVYEVKLSFSGEIPDITESEEPISRADESTPKRVYGINVWCMKADGSETSYKNYAYGLFDNKDDMIISLLGGYKYRFECYMVEDDIDKLYIPADRITGRYPFCFQKIDNKFVIGSSSSGFYFNNTRITTQKAVAYYNHPDYYQSHPTIGIFYGIINDYTPSQNSVATIPIYKIGYYGLRIVVSDVPDGTLEVDPGYYDFDEDWLQRSQTFTESGSMEKLFTGGFYRALSNSGTYVKDWLSEMQNFSTSSNVSFTWTRGNGYKQTFDKTVTLKRNVMTILTVNLTGGAGEVSLGFEEHSEDMSTENDSVDFDGGDMNDTPVDPTE